MSPMMILGILLAVSVALNGWQYSNALSDATRYGTTKQLAEDTKAAAGACTQSVRDLDRAGKTRQSALILALNGIAPKVAELQAQSLEAGRAKPDDPKDLCGSLERYLRGQVKAERGLK